MNKVCKSVFHSLRFDQAAQKIINRNPFGYHKGLWEFLLQHSEVNIEKRWADLATKEQNKLIRSLCACEFAIKGKTTFKEEFVTAGGIYLDEVDANTMMSKKLPNLFFAGEILNVGWHYRRIQFSACLDKWIYCGKKYSFCLAGRDKIKRLNV
jgi:predicted flavoprotein YhiN